MKDEKILQSSDNSKSSSFTTTELNTQSQSAANSLPELGSSASLTDLSLSSGRIEKTESDYDVQSLIEKSAKHPILDLLEELGYDPVVIWRIMRNQK